jgi:NADH dehydrogenase/NADH:ubiquinone oxidoreductase subunit G
MINLNINGSHVSVKKGATLLEAAKSLGIFIPTLCYDKDIPSYGACRLCMVEIGEEPRTKMVSSCTYPAEEGLIVRTDTPRVEKARKMILELYLASCPRSRVIHDLAARYGVTRHRFKQEYEDCILCGLCVRRCKQQMASKAIAFRGRGENRSIGVPFEVKSELCRPCGECIRKAKKLEIPCRDYRVS